jgi:signal transduction histidine kinase
MNRFWKQFEELAIALRGSLTVDIFTEARFKIAFLYFLTGVLIFSAASYVLYEQTIEIIQNVVGLLQQAITQHVPGGISTAIITQTVNAQVQRMNVTVGLWVILAMLVSAYIFAGMILFPIKRAMDKQRRFVADVAHELRTPLSVMKMDAEVTLLDESLATREELLAIVKSNLEEIDRMARTTQFLLDLSHLESRLSKLTLSQTNLSAIVVRATQFMQKFATEKNITLTLQPVLPATIKGNPVAVEEIIVNLLKNAIAYTHSGGSVTVSLWHENSRTVTLTVTDTGVGISPEDLPNLFEPFYRGKNTNEPHADHHSGLGLAIVKELARLHQAMISVKSVSGKGTSVSIRFSGSSTKHPLANIEEKADSYPDLSSS